MRRNITPSPRFIGIVGIFSTTCQSRATLTHALGPLTYGEIRMQARNLTIPGAHFIRRASPKKEKAHAEHSCVARRRWHRVYRCI
jgi:hypothetical protein